MKNMEMMVRLYHHFPRSESPDFRRCGFLFALVLIDWQLSGLFLRPGRFCPDSATCKLLLCQARSLSRPPLPRFRHLPSLRRGIPLPWTPCSPSVHSSTAEPGGEYPFRGHGTPRRFFQPQLNRAGNELPSRVPLPVRSQLASFFRRGIPLPGTRHSPSVFPVTA